MMTIDQLSTLVGHLIESRGNELRASVSRDRFTSLVTHLVNDHRLPLALLYGTDDRVLSGTFGVHVVCSLAQTHQWLIISTKLPQDDPRYESITKTVMASHWYERLMMDLFGIVAEGHPDARRLVHHENVPDGTHPLRKDFEWNTKMPHAEVAYPMHHVEGDGIFEIPVGPIHAGIIEPGHFRFNVAGERIITLEGKLFFTHKGVEKLLEGKTPFEALPLIERVSGDAAASHALAFCQAIESIGNVKISERASYLRTFLCELERITMHIHDVSNMAGMGTGYTVMAAQGFRIKERMMRLSERLVGNRFWRGMIVPGGCEQNFSDAQLADLLETVTNSVEEIQSLIQLALRSSGLRERLETTGVLSQEAAIAYGGRGLPVRASGVEMDVRRDHPYAAYDRFKISFPTKKSGDVYARFLLRAEELEISLSLIQQMIPSLPSGTVVTTNDVISGCAFGAVESYRGEILTFVSLEQGKITRCVVRDPSFCNWPLFGEIGPGNIIPDFPLCNKSLNLSYSGTDL